MVRVAPAQVIDVQGNQGMVDEALEKFVNQVDIKLTDTGARVTGLVFQSGPAGTVQHHT